MQSFGSSFKHPAIPEAGFTLVELMVVIAIIAILATLALPSFNGLLADAALKEQTESLMDDLRYARSMSMKRGRSVTLCATTTPLATTPACAASNPDWSKGWIIFVDETVPLNDTFQATDELLRRQEAASRSGGIDTGTGGSAGEPPRFLRFNPEGRSTGMQSSFIFKSPNGDATLDRTICLATTGRPRVTAKGTTTC
jgi:type IV fimbrial biogenesis protein FimT